MVALIWGHDLRLRTTGLEIILLEKMLRLAQRFFAKLLQIEQYNFEAHLLHLSFCFRLDYCGIALLTIGSFVPWLYYSFYCRLETKVTYLALIFFLGTICIVVSMWDKFAQPQYRPLRAGKKNILNKPNFFFFFVVRNAG